MSAARIPEGFVPVAWHVYRLDHTGRGIPVPAPQGMSRERAEIVAMGRREMDHLRPSFLNPVPPIYLVAEAANGQRVPDYGRVRFLPPSPNRKVHAA